MTEVMKSLMIRRPYGKWMRVGKSIPEHVYAEAETEVFETAEDSGHIVVGGQHYDWKLRSRRRNSKRSAQKRISAALSKFLKKQNPAMKRATHVRVKKLKGGGITILPA